MPSTSWKDPAFLTLRCPVKTHVMAPDRLLPVREAGAAPLSPLSRSRYITVTNACKDRQHPPHRRKGAQKRERRGEVQRDWKTEGSQEKGRWGGGEGGREGEVNEASAFCRTKRRGNGLFTPRSGGVGGQRLWV